MFTGLHWIDLISLSLTLEPAIYGLVKNHFWVLFIFFGRPVYNRSKSKYLMSVHVTFVVNYVIKPLPIIET